MKDILGSVLHKELSIIMRHYEGSVTLLDDPGSALETWKSPKSHLMYQATIAVE